MAAVGGDGTGGGDIEASRTETVDWAGEAIGAMTVPLLLCVGAAGVYDDDVDEAEDPRARRALSVELMRACFSERNCCWPSNGGASESDPADERAYGAKRCDDDEAEQSEKWDGDGDGSGWWLLVAGEGVDSPAAAIRCCWTAACWAMRAWAWSAWYCWASRNSCVW